MLYVCSLSKLDRVVEAVKASHLVSVVNPDMEVIRPKRIAPENHLFLGMNDIAATIPGFTLSTGQQVAQLIAFLHKWDRSAPMVIHCWAGVSRSTASAYIAACALRPDLDEMLLAEDLRKASPPATPNRRLVELADELLGRDGRMNEAIRSIGRGADCYEGNVFAMPHID
ncbi:tyrosine phosphatase family protein [Cohaesibacter haloalkalitolerans]|uniref:tyrosine phosphatase family protein n=1 Tax=Cohaesibacter haloalkalitolerans TaxID=1162980 RepID=UPI000E652494|nr:protein-tyrosine phosphatase family protein [Cohaesibacter haloalkalitolerans]